MPVIVLTLEDFLRKNWKAIETRANKLGVLFSLLDVVETYITAKSAQ